MLRTTISRIKKAWTIAFVPRLLRGDQRCAPGKFDIFSYAVLRKAPKSTKSTDEGKSDQVEQNDGADYIFKCKEEAVEAETSAKEFTNPGDEATKENINPLIPSRILPKESHCQKCQRIIDKAFGKTQTVETMLGEHYYSHSVNIEETRRKIKEAENARLKFAQEFNVEKPITDNRAQFGVFKMSREPTTDELSLEYCQDKVTSEKGGAKIVEGEDLDLVQETLNVHLTAGKEPDLTNKLNSLPRYVEDPLPLQETTGYEAVDMYVHNQEKLENKAFYDLQENEKSLVDDINLSQTIKEERLDDIRNVVLLGPGEDAHNKHDMSFNPSFKLTDTSETDHGDVAVNAENQEKIDHILNDFISHAQRDTILQATTASEAEEQLTQKVEHIDETPLVEAQRPKIEGFNVAPRVLGDADSQFSCFSEKQPDNFHPHASPNVDAQADLDEVAKRCLDSPIGKIDEILLNEMEKIGIPVSCTTENQARSPVIEDDLVQMDEARGQQKEASNEQEYTVSSELKSAIEFSAAEKLLYPSHIMNTEKILPEQVEELENVVLESVPEVAREEERYSMHPNQVFIYPNHKQVDKALNYHSKNYSTSERTKENTKKSAYYFMPTALLIEKQEKIEQAYLSSVAKSRVKSSTSVFQSSPEKPQKSENKELIGNVFANATALPDTQKVTSDSHTLASHLCDSIVANTLRAEKTPLDSPVMLGNTKSPTDRKMMEIEQLSERAAEEPKVEETPASLSIEQQTPSFDPPRLNVTSISNDPEAKPDRYAQRIYDKETSKAAYYSANNNAPNTMWNEHNYYQKSDQRYPQRMYAKGLDRQSSYYQPMANEWNLQQPRLDDKYAHKMSAQKSYGKEADKSSPYYTMGASNKTWNQQSYHPDYKYNNMYGNRAGLDTFYTRNISAGYTWQNTQTCPDSRSRQMQDNYERREEASNKVRAQAITKEEQVDMKQTNKAYANVSQADADYEETQCSSNLCVPDGTWDRKTLLQSTVNKMTSPISFNKTNINVSDGIWDENIEPEITTERQKGTKKVSLPDEILNQQLDPYYVLTCNETCPISPKPVVGTCETSGIADTTETIFEQDVKKPATYEPDSSILSEFDRKKRQGLKRYMKRFTRSNSANVTANVTETLSLPNLSENVALSELLKRVRERSRIIECRNELKTLGVEIEPAQGKCGRKAPRCPPTAPRSPPNNPVPPPSFGLPSLKRRPNACKPRKPRTRKCSACDIGTAGLQLGPQLNAHMIEVGPEMVCEMNDAGAGVCTIKSKADLTEEIVDRLQSLGRMLGNVIQQGKAHVLDIGCLLKNRGGSKTMLARDFEPWSPIPSWPEPKAAEKKSPPCTPGCKIFPPPRVCAHPDPPCDQKPCEGFPKKSFSMLDCFAVSLGDHKVYDLGEF